MEGGMNNEAGGVGVWTNKAKYTIGLPTVYHTVSWNQKALGFIQF